MKFSQMGDSKYLASKDLSSPIKVTILGYGTAEVREGEIVTTLRLKEFKKEMILNKTNGKRISSVYGDDSDHSIGKQMVLYVDDNVVNKQGEIVSGLRLRPLPKGVGVQGDSDVPF